MPQGNIIAAVSDGFLDGFCKIEEALEELATITSTKKKRNNTLKEDFYTALCLNDLCYTPSSTTHLDVSSQIRIIQGPGAICNFIKMQVGKMGTEQEFITSMRALSQYIAENFYDHNVNKEDVIDTIEQTFKRAEKRIGAVTMLDKAHAPLRILCLPAKSCSGMEAAVYVQASIEKCYEGYTILLPFQDDHRSLCESLTLSIAACCCDIKVREGQDSLNDLLNYVGRQQTQGRFHSIRLFLQEGNKEIIWSILSSYQKVAAYILAEP